MRKKRRATRDGCTKKSVLVQQRKNDSSPAVTSFLKIMIGENLSRFLYLPPKFARTVMHLAGQKTQLEDVNGLRWSVTVRVIDGSLAFGSGWSNFFLDHNITEGEFLVFDYVKENYFLVKIFETSCCEKVRFVLSGPQLNKRRRLVMETDSEVAAVYSPRISSNLWSTSPISNAIIPDFKNVTVNPTCMMEIDRAQYHEEDRSFLLDLSKFEMEKETNRAIMEEETMYSIEASHADTCKIQMTQEEAFGLQMLAIDADLINSPSSDIFTSKSEMASVAKASPVETDIRMQSKIHCKDTSAYVNLANHVSVEPVETSTCTLGTVKLKHHVKKKEGNKMGETSQDGVSGENLDGKHEKASWAEIEGSSKIAEMEHAVKHKPLEPSIPSFMFKNPGKLMVKKEFAESSQSSYDFDEGEELTEGNYEQMCTPVVKVERGVETETGIKAGPNFPHSDIGPLVGSHTFSAEVKTLPYMCKSEIMPPLSPSQRGPQCARSKSPKPATFSPRAAIQLISTPSSFIEAPHPFIGSDSFADSPVKKIPQLAIREPKKKKKIKTTLPSGPDQTHNPPSQEVRKCLHCEITKTPQWRAGTMGLITLCNACGVRYRSGRLFPEYRPAASPTFVSSMHSNSHKKVVEMRINGVTAIQPPISAKPDSGCTI